MAFEPVARRAEALIAGGAIGRVAAMRTHMTANPADRETEWQRIGRNLARIDTPPTDQTWMYQAGEGGPLFDLTPYQLIPPTRLLGPIKRVGALAGIAVPERVSGSGPTKGQRFATTAPDNVVMMLDWGEDRFGMVYSDICRRTFGVRTPSTTATRGFSRSTGARVLTTSSFTAPSPVAVRAVGSRWASRTTVGTLWTAPVRSRTWWTASRMTPRAALRASGAAHPRGDRPRAQVERRRPVPTDNDDGSTCRGLFPPSPPGPTTLTLRASSRRGGRPRCAWCWRRRTATGSNSTSARATACRRAGPSGRARTARHSGALSGACRSSHRTSRRPGWSLAGRPDHVVRGPDST